MRLTLLAILLAAAPVTAATRSDDIAYLEVVRAGDLRVATVGERLAMANVALCGRTQYRTGLLLHDIRQYAPGLQDAAREAFGFERDVAVEGVVPGSPADQAGVRQDSAVVALDGERIDGIGAGKGDSFARMGAVLDRMEAALEDGALTLDTLHAGQPGRFVVHARKGCYSRFQLVLEGAVNAGADGQYVQVDGRMVDFVENDAELAAVLAHELAHNILDHRRRLDAQGVNRGMLGVLGRSAGLIKATEMEADRLSLYLMANAGYDPQAAVGFWDRLGAKTGYGIFSDGTHLRRRPRVALLQEEMKALAALRARTPAGQPLIPDLAKPPFPALR